MVTSPNEWKILVWDVKPKTNKKSGMLSAKFGKFGWYWPGGSGEKDFKFC